MNRLVGKFCGIANNGRMILSLIIGCFAVISCVQHEMENLRESDKEITEYVDVGFSPVDIEVSESPMTKSLSSSDLYGLCIWERDVDNPFSVDRGQVYDENGKPCKDENGKYLYRNDTIYNYLSYACWLSDDLTSSAIRLRKDRVYLCAVVYVPDGKNVIYHYGNGQYGNPFYNNGPSRNPILGAGVHYGGGYDMERAIYGAAQARDKRDCMRTANDMNTIDIYYGAKVIKATKNEEIIVNLYRMMYGLEIQATNLTEGKIHVYGGWNVYNYAKALDDDAYVYSMTPDSPSLDLVLELSVMPWKFDAGSLICNTPTDGRIENWKSGHTINVDYEYPNGDILRLFSKAIDGKRMVKYTMNFDVAELLQEYNDSFKQNVIEDSWTTEVIE